jgi:hypothetical protein
MVNHCCRYDFESYISYDKKLITETEYLEIKTTIKAIFDDIVFAENDIDRYSITDS